MSGKISQEEVAVLKTIYDRHSDMDKMIDTKTYILSAIFAGTLFLSINAFISLNSEMNSLLGMGLAILSFSSFFSLVLSISSIRPIHFRKRSPLNLFFYGHFLDRLTEEEYARKLDEMMRDKDKLLKEFVKEIYGLSRNVLAPSYRKIRIASDVFVAGLFIGGIMMAVSIFG